MLGKQSFFEIINQTAKQAVGNAGGVDSQAAKLLDAFSENGILNQNSSDFSITACYDENGSFTGVELTSSKAGTLIEKPKNTVYRQEVVSVVDKNVTNSSGDSSGSTKENNAEINKNKDGSEANGEESGSKKRDDDLEEKPSKENDSETKKNAEESGDLNKRDTNEGDSDTVKKEEKLLGEEMAANDKEVENTQAEESLSSDKQSDSKEHVSELEEKTVSDKNSNAENHTDSQENAGSNTEKTETANVEGSSKQNTKSESSENHSAKENGSADNNMGKETAGIGNESGNSQSHDTQTSESGLKTEDHHVDNTDHKKPDVAADSKAESLSGKKNNDIDLTGEKTKIDADTDVKVELSDSSKKIIQLYEKVSGEKVDIETSAKISKGLNKCSKAIDLAGNTLDLIDGAVAVYKAVNLYVDGDTNGACKVLSDYGFSTLASMGTGVVAMAVIGLGTVNPILGFAFIIAMGYQGAKWGEEFSDWWFKKVLGLYDEAGSYTYPVDPLIFDLNGNGIETVSVNNGVNFDFDSNGFAEKIGWVGAEDGLLVRDLDGNGRIDSGRELMGDLTELADGTNAANGFEAFAGFDLNGDGLIDANDTIYDALRIWKDCNKNGAVEDGELLTLGEAGIDSISLEYSDITEVDENGNVHTQRGTFTRTDGTVAAVEDVWFAKDAADTVLNAGYAILEETEEIAKLPDIQGKGNQYSLHQAMLRDESGTLQAMVERYAAEEDRFARKAMLTDIIYMWTGVTEKDPYSRGGNVSDARKLEALEVISGRPFNSRYGSNPVAQAAEFIDMAFDRLVEMYFVQMEQQTSWAGLYSVLFQNMEIDDSGNISFGVEGIADYLKPFYAEDPGKASQMLVNFISNVKALKLDDRVDQKALRDEVSVFGDVFLHALDYMGDDTIHGEAEGSVFTAEAGNDILYGKNGDDAYVFNRGDGRDMIYDAGGTDRILFGEGISPDDIRVTRDRRSLFLTNRKTDDRVQVDGFFTGNGRVETIEFSDGTVWDIEETKKLAGYYYGTDRGETISAFDPVPVSETGISGSSSGSASAAAVDISALLSVSTGPSMFGQKDDYIYGWGGNDILYGNMGDDHLYGGEGNDSLYGGEDDDILYGEEGNDSLEGGNGNDALIGGTGDDSLYGENGDDRLYGGTGNDILSGDAGDDTLTGGAGNDTLIGGYGNDTYIFGCGYGQDTITESDPTEGNLDTVRFGEDIRKEDIRFSRSGNNLLVSILGTQDSIQVKDQFGNEACRVECFQAGDGSFVDYTKLDLMIQAMASFEDTTGMMWEQAVENRNETAENLISQWWVKEAV